MGSLQLLSRKAELAPITESDDPFKNWPNELLSHIFVLSSGSLVMPVFYCPPEVPHQLTISQVCSRWRQVALSTGVLWSNVKLTCFNVKYADRLRLYRTWVGRAGDYPLTVSVIYYSLSGWHSDLRKVFLDFIVPFRIKTLDIKMSYHHLMDLPSLSVEALAIAGINLPPADEYRKAPPFMDKTRRICIWLTPIPSEECEPKLKELSLSWHQLRSFECYSCVVSLSTWLNVLSQSQTLQNLERCHLSISDTGSGALVGVCMPNLRRLSLSLESVRPDIVFPLIAAPNITTLWITSQDNWSSDVYDIIKRHYKLYRLHKLLLQGTGFPLRIGQILADAPMIRKLDMLCRLSKPILDTEAREGIASGRLGRCLTTLHISGSFDDHVGEWFDMIETRQRNVKSMVTQVSNWREMFTGIKSVEVWGVPNGDRDYNQRVAALKALGTTVRIV